MTSCDNTQEVAAIRQRRNQEVKDMSNINADTQIIDHDIHSVDYTGSSTHGYYHFVSATIIAKVWGHDAVLQTGHGYDYNDYNHPTNTLSVYTDESSLLFILDNCLESELVDSEFVAYQINEPLDTSYTYHELVGIYDALNELKAGAQHIINDAEREADEALSSNNKCYVLHPDVFPMIDHTGHTVQPCEDTHALEFESENDAQEFLDSLSDYHSSYIVSKEEAHLYKHPHLSNF